VGEFEGRDAGSPVVASVQSSVAAVDRFSIAGQAPQAYDGSQPIETLVEREPVRPTSGVNNLRQAAEAGLYFLRLLNAAQLPASIANLYRAQYPLGTGASASSDVAALERVIAGRVIDGVKLHADLVAAGASLPAAPAIPAAQHDAVLKITRNWLQWYSSLFAEPDSPEAAWSADQLEYRFSMATADDTGSWITSLSVADTFGITTTIPHYSTVDGKLGRWHMFSISPDPLAPPVLWTSAQPPLPLLLTPSALAPLDSSAIEDVLLLRDELASLVWGIERTVFGASGLPLDRTLEWRMNAPAAAPPSGDPTLHYRLGSTAPDYWLPYLPVKLDPAGHLQLRRGRLPNTATGPQGRMLAEAATILLEEVPREGVHLERRYRWARGVDGAGYLWIGRRRSTGRGEGRSGLRFDYLE
jgi:hypothetical protein